MVAAQKNKHDLRLERLALLVRAVGGQDDALHALRERKTEIFADGFALLHAGRGALFHRLGGSCAAVKHGVRFGELDVCGIVRVRAVGDHVFARIGDHLEFVRARAADGARVGAHGAVHEAEPIEDAAVGVVHLLVGKTRRRFVTIEGVRVLHDEFAPAHHAEAGAAFIAELRLDVEDVERKLTPAADFLTNDVGGHLFGRGLNDEVAVVPVLDAQEFGPVLVPAARFLPKFSRLHDRHQKLHGARADHFFADDRFDLADDAQADRHVGVDAGGQLLDHAGADHVLLTDDVGIGRSLFERGNKKGTSSHGKLLCGRRAGPRIVENGCWPRPPRRAVERWNFSAEAPCVLAARGSGLRIGQPSVGSNRSSSRNAVSARRSSSIFCASAFTSASHPSRVAAEMAKTGASSSASASR